MKFSSPKFILPCYICVSSPEMSMNDEEGRFTVYGLTDSPYALHPTSCQEISSATLLVVELWRLTHEYHG